MRNLMQLSRLATTTRLIVATLFAIVFSTTSAPASAAALDVDVLTDTSNPGECSLRDAVAAANMDTAINGCAAGAAGVDTITVPAGQITLLSGALPVTSPIEVVGAGLGTTIIDGNGADRLFDAPTTATDAPMGFTDLTMQNATSTNAANQGTSGARNGGAVRGYANITLTRVHITDVQVPVNPVSWGAGVWTDFADVTIIDSQIDNASGRSAVAAISRRGLLTITGSTVADTVGSGDSSGAIYGHLGVVVDDSVFRNNRSGYGGAILALGPVTVSSSTFIDGRGRGGGGIASNSDVTVVDSTFTGNEGYLDGGAAIQSYTGAVTVQRSTFIGNNATAANGYGGAIIAATTATISDSYFESNSAAAYGGAVYAPTVDVDRSTFSANKANYGSAVSSYATAPLHGIDSESSTYDGNISPAVGGAIYTNSTTSSLRYNTFVDNSSPAGADLYSDAGGDVELNGNIFATTASGTNCVGVFTSAGGNVSEEPVDSCLLTAADDLLGQDAQLGVLQVNAPGAVPTRAIPLTSPAVDHVSLANCASGVVDQRGVIRADGAVTGPQCDAGAFESEITFGSLHVELTAVDPALTGVPISAMVTCPNSAGSPFAATIEVNGMPAVIDDIEAGDVCTIVPLYPAGIAGPASFDSPVIGVLAVVVASNAVTAIPPPTTTTTTLAPTTTTTLAPTSTTTVAPTTTTTLAPTTTVAATTPPSTAGPAPTTSPTTTTTTVAPHGRLPATGSTLGVPSKSAAAFVVAGLALLALARRPRTHPSNG